MANPMSIADIRREYRLGGLRRKDLRDDPLQQFAHWLEQAIEAGIAEATAMVLATADKQGRPSSRVVLLKGFDERGFQFFTNYESRKGRELAENPHAALNFFWPALERQICITGSVAKLPREESELYFRTRPLGSRRAAWVSKQTEVIASRDLLEHRLAEVLAQYPGEEIPTPPYWGGFALKPAAIEFWQGRESRLHDRFQYTLLEDGAWRIDRLAP